MMLFRQAAQAAAGGAFALALAGSPAAQAQTPSIPASAYRQGEPDVIAPAALASNAMDAPAFHRAAFAAAYARAGRPAMAVLWNREFSDMLEQSTASQVRVDSASARTGEALGMAVRGPGAALAYGQADAAAVAHATITAGEVKTTQARRHGPAERVDLQMRAAFLQTMASSGVRLVDRNLVMRTTAARQKAKSAGLDSQQIETEAIAAHARLLMEVLATRDAAAPLGWSVFVSIKRMADGVVLTEGYMDGLPPQDAPRPAPRFEADPRGGYREAVQPLTASDVGRRAGEQTLARLEQALAR